jgi:hypothetical protein
VIDGWDNSNNKETAKKKGKKPKLLGQTEKIQQHLFQLYARSSFLSCVHEMFCFCDLECSCTEIKYIEKYV